MAGWDVIRSNRYQRQIELGIVGKDCPLTPRDSRVPAWETVADKKWEANRMATHAAMIERMDRGIGRILDRLKEKGIDDNTLIIFFSDNGACAEVIEPGWYDIPSRTREGRAVKVGNRDHTAFAGPDEVWQSYGVPWANVSSTPFRLYKHFTHEGGITTPFIARWPSGIKNVGVTTKQSGHLTDVMATCLELAGAKRTMTQDGRAVPPVEGTSLLPAFTGQNLDRIAPIFWEHEGNRAVRSGRWKLVARHNSDWELYDMEKDRVELNNLALCEPERVKMIAALYDAWATRCGVVPPEQLPPQREIVPAKTSETTQGRK